MPRAGSDLDLGKDNKFEPGKPLVFVTCLVPTRPDGFLSGSGVMHLAYARELERDGNTVVLVEATNHLLKKSDRPNHRILFAPDSAAQSRLPGGAERFEPVAPHNFPIFTQVALSATRFMDLPDGQLARTVPLWQWGIYTSMIVYGVPDAVWNSHTWTTNAITGPVLPTAWTCHGTCVQREAGFSETRFHALNRSGIQQAMLGFATSPSSLATLKDPRRYGVPEGKIHKAFNGYDPSAFHPNVDGSRTDLLHSFGDQLQGLSADHKWVVFAGKAAHVKGLDLLLEALAKGGGQIPESVHLIIVGSRGDETIQPKHPFTGGNLTSYVHNEVVKSSGLQGRVHFVGSLPQAEMARFIKAADAYVLTSRDESFGLVFVEGQAVGKRPVVSNIPAFRDIVAGYEGAPETIANFFEADDPRSSKVFDRVFEAVRADPHVPRRKSVLSLLYKTTINLELGQITLPKSRNKKSLQIIYDRLRAEARRAAVESLVKAVVQDLAEPDVVKDARGRLAAEFAKAHWTVADMIKFGNLPRLRKLMLMGNRVSFDLKVPPRLRHHPLREERLVALEKAGPCPRVQDTFQALKGALDQKSEGVGEVWRRFQHAVAYHIGTEANFLNPFDPKAYGFNRPISIFEEVSRMAGVTLDEMLSVMRQVRLVPARELAGTTGSAAIEAYQREQAKAVQPGAVLATGTSGATAYSSVIPFVDPRSLEEMTWLKVASFLRGGVIFFMGDRLSDLVLGKARPLDLKSVLVDFSALTVGNHVGQKMASHLSATLNLAESSSLRAFLGRMFPLLSGLTALDLAHTGRFNPSALPQTAANVMVASGSVMAATSLASRSESVSALGRALRLVTAGGKATLGGAILASAAEFTIIKWLNHLEADSAESQAISTEIDRLSALLYADYEALSELSEGGSVPDSYLRQVDGLLSQWQTELLKVKPLPERQVIADHDRAARELREQYEWEMQQPLDGTWSRGELADRYGADLRRLQEDRDEALVEARKRPAFARLPVTQKGDQEMARLLNAIDEDELKENVDMDGNPMGDEGGITVTYRSLLARDWPSLAMQLAQYRKDRQSVIDRFVPKKPMVKMELAQR